MAEPWNISLISSRPLPIFTGCARPGGTIIHISPLTWFNHGFYNFNPKLFKGLIQANGYEFLVEAFWIPPNPKRFFWQKKGPQIFITFDGKEEPEAIKTWEIFSSTSPAVELTLYDRL
jgi:hypothetical protein